jgi:hypothetical protein
MDEENDQQCGQERQENVQQKDETCTYISGKGLVKELLEVISHIEYISVLTINAGNLEGLRQ